MSIYGQESKSQQWSGHEQGFDTEAVIGRLIELVDSAKSMPLSNNVILPRDEVRDLLAACLENLPLEVRQANWLLRERSEFLAKMQREGDEILRTATERSQRLVERSELVREARRVAQHSLDDADVEARRLKHEAEEYVDLRLAEFEQTLEATFRIVQAGREKLRAAPPLMDAEEMDSVESAVGRMRDEHQHLEIDPVAETDNRGERGAFFDQERFSHDDERV